MESCFVCTAQAGQEACISRKFVKAARQAPASPFLNPLPEHFLTDGMYVGDLRVEVSGRQLRILGMRFPPPRPQPKNVLFSSDLLGEAASCTRQINTVQSKHLQHTHNPDVCQPACDDKGDCTVSKGCC